MDLINLSISSLPSTWKFTNQSTSPLIRNLEEIARGRKYCEERRRRKGRSIESKNIRLSGEKILWFHRKINSRGISFPREMGRDNKWRIIARNTINPWSTFYIFPFESFLWYPWINYPPKSDEREKENSLQLVRSGSKFLDRNRREIGSLRTLLKIPNVVVRFWNALKFGFHFVRFIEIVRLSLHITEQITCNPLCHVGGGKGRAGKKFAPILPSPSLFQSRPLPAWILFRARFERLLFSNYALNGGGKKTRKVSRFFRE